MIDRSNRLWGLRWAPMKPVCAQDVTLWPPQVCGFRRVILPVSLSHNSLADHCAVRCDLSSWGGLPRGGSESDGGCL